MNPSTKSDPSRRAFIKQCAAGVVLIPAAALVACKGNLTCNDLAGLTPDEQQMRTTNQYVDRSTDPAKHCDNCMQFVPAAPDKCGTCKVLKGPINPNGNCGLWT